MVQSMVENCASSTVEEEAAAACAPPAAIPRRPRVREVSSRFMSPAPHPLPLKSPLAKQHHMSTPTSTLSEIQARQRYSSVNRQRRQLEMEPLRCSDDSETPFPTKLRPVHVKPFKENGGPKQLPPQFPPQFDQFAQQQHRQQQHKQLSSSRPDTPMAMVATVSTVVTADRTPRSRHVHQHQRSATPTAAAKLLQFSGLSSEANVRSSMPNEADLFEKSSTRVSAASPCSRSLTFPLTSCDHSSLVPQNKACLSKPPVPPCAPPKLPFSDHLRKPKKVSSHQDYVHSLKLLHNRYLQWRFANARAQASMLAQQRETERMLYSLAVKVAALYDSVKTKRMELGLLLRTKTLSTILEAQIPYLDQWFALEEDYSIYLAEATQALLNASAQLPISANVKADVREVKEALNSAREVLEIIVFDVQRSMSKSEETENLISELARMVGGEKALIEECGNVLSKTYSKQVEEWSLRGQIIQVKRRCC